MALTADTPTEPPLRMSLAEFLEWDDGSDTRYELVDGEVWGMAATTQAHSRLVTGLLANLVGRLPSQCAGHVGLGVVPPHRLNSFYSPDFLVDCGPAKPGSPTATEPTVIVEILSPSTRDFDLGQKRAAYQGIASLQHLLLVDSERPWAQALRRVDAESWLIRDHRPGQPIDLGAYGGALDLGPLWDAAGVVEPPEAEAAAQ